MVASVDALTKPLPAAEDEAGAPMYTLTFLFGDVFFAQLSLTFRRRSVDRDGDGDWGACHSPRAKVEGLSKHHVSTSLGHEGRDDNARWCLQSC